MMYIALPRRARRWSLGACALALASACSDPVAPRAAATAPLSADVAASAVKVDRLMMLPVDPARGWKVAPGDTIRLRAIALDARGQRLAVDSTAYRWSTSTPTRVTVGATTGVTVASATSTLGSAYVTAHLGAVTTTHSVVVAADAEAPDTSGADTTAAPSPTAPTPGATAVALWVRRFDNKSTAVVVSNAVPLAPGVLQPGQERDVRVFAGATPKAAALAEQAAWVTPTATRHPDGSVRSVIVQFRAPAFAARDSLPARLEIGGARPAAMVLAKPLVTPGAAASGAPAGLPGAAVLPNDPAYLIATGVAGGPTVSSATARTFGPKFAQYESDFATYAENRWRAEGTRWADANYYDRALVFYAAWVRTGKSVYWARAGQIARAYRHDYLEPSDYSVNPKWSQIEGVEQHYTLTGDEGEPHLDRARRLPLHAVPAQLLHRAVHRRAHDGSVPPLRAVGVARHAAVGRGAGQPAGGGHQ